MDPDFYRPQRKRHGKDTKVPYIRKFLDLMASQKKRKQFKAVNNDVYVPIRLGGADAYGYFKNKALYQRYINCLESTLTYTTYYDHIHNTFYAIDFLSIKLSSFDKQMLLSILQPFVGQFFSASYDTHKFCIMIKDECDHDYSFSFIAKNNNHYKCEHCKKAEFKLTLYAMEFYMYDVKMVHEDKCLGRRIESDDESL